MQPYPVEIEQQMQRYYESLSESEHRNEQFENIAQLIEEYQAAGYPVISMDTNKKELIGNLYREGQLYTQETIEVFDHDWPSLADGVAIPHGLWDLTYNIGYIQIGTSHDTSEFVCDSVDYWWNTHGKFLYANATKILILCDGGGSNNSRHYVFKQDLFESVEVVKDLMARATTKTGLHVFTTILDKTYETG